MDPLGASWNVTWQSQKPVLNLFYLLSLNWGEVVSCPSHRTVKTHSYDHITSIIEWALFHFWILSTYYLFIKQYVHISCFLDMFEYSFSLISLVCLLCIKFSYMYKSIYLVFFFCCVMLVYHRHTNANVSSWWETTQWNIFFHTKQPVIALQK